MHRFNIIFVWPLVLFSLIQDKVELYFYQAEIFFSRVEIFKRPSDDAHYLMGFVDCMMGVVTCFGMTVHVCTCVQMHVCMHT